MISFVLPPQPREGWFTRLLFLATAILIWSPALPAPAALFEGAKKEPVAVQEWHRRGIVGALTDPNRQVLVAGIDLQKQTLIIIDVIGVLKSLNESDKARLTECLAKGLREDSPIVRAAAVAALGQLGDKQVVPELVNLLHEQNLYVRTAAATALGQLDDKQVAPELVNLLREQDPDVHAAADVRAAAATALGQLGDKQAAPELIKLLQDQDPEVLAAAAIALGQLGEKQAEPELSNLLINRDSNVRAAAATALRQLGYMQAAPEFVNLLINRDSNVRAAAATALGQLGDKQVAPELIKLLHDQVSYVRAAAANALGQLGDKQAALELIKLLHDQDPEVRGAAATALAQLGDKQVAPELVDLLHDQDLGVRAAAATALGQLGDKQIASELVKLLDDRSDMVIARAAVALGLLGDKQAAPELVKLLHDRYDMVIAAAAVALGLLGDKQVVPELVQLLHYKDPVPRWAAIRALFYVGPVDVGTLPAILNPAYGNEDIIGEVRFDAHLLGGGQPDVEVAIACLGKNAPESCQLSRVSSSDARRYLKVFRQVWDSSREYPEVRDDLAEKTAELAYIQGWTSENLEDLKYLRSKMLSQGGPSAVAANSIPTSPNQIFRWFGLYGYAWAAQPIFWIALIFLYPRFTSVQAIFFWNPWVRRFLGFGYVGLLLTWVPFLRKRLLAPFRDSLLADADPANFDSGTYFANCFVVLKPSEHPEPIARVIPEIRGEIVLEGESGLGKTMFLRSLTKSPRRPMVYLLAQRCSGGVIEAIQDKLFGYAQDKTFLQSLVFSGGIDVSIDGLNEVSPDTRAQVSSFIERYFRANVIVGTQPLEWTPPKTAKVYTLQPLTPEQIRAFLLSRETILPEGAVRRGSAYESACNSYLAGIFNSKRDDDAKDNTQSMLSNPMDLTVVATMLSRGEQPDVFRLREQQYRIMADEYKRTNLGQDFPLNAFSEHCYQLRLHDELAISAQQFQKELLCMERLKLVVTRQSKGSDEKVEWLFRHDRIMEFFVAQTFLGRGNDRPQQHMGDARFRGVFLLLATLLPLDAATVLRERLVDYAADTKDHTVSDTFVQLLRGRKAT